MDVAEVGAEIGEGGGVGGREGVEEEGCEGFAVGGDKRGEGEGCVGGGGVGVADGLWREC